MDSKKIYISEFERSTVLNSFACLVKESFDQQCSPHIETSILTCRADQLIGF